MEEARARNTNKELSKNPLTKHSLHVDPSTPDYFKIALSSNEFLTSLHGGHFKRDPQPEVY